VIHLRSIALKESSAPREGFPFTLPLLSRFKPLTFRTPVTFFVGENGSGKSTLLEGIAAGAGSVAVGGADLARDATLDHARRLGDALRLTWNRKRQKGFFLRAEDFFNFAKRTHSLTNEMDDLASEYDQRFSGYGRQLAMGVAKGQRAALVQRYGENLDAHSHGESFLKLFQARFAPGGLYLLDEPEAPLSPQRQIALLALLKEMVAKDGQFLIATHSPILMAFPGAEIYSFDRSPLQRVAYDDLEHVSLTKAFLADPSAFLRRL
jgi:predicted ATPase